MQDKTIFVKNIELENFSCFEHLKVDKFANINLIVGDNDSGKSKLLDAICLFFDYTKIYTDRFFIYDIHKDAIYEKLFNKKNNITALQSKISIDNKLLKIQDNTRDIDDTDINQKDIEQSNELFKNEIISDKVININFKKGDNELFDIISDVKYRLRFLGKSHHMLRLNKHNIDEDAKKIYYKKSSQHNSGFADYFKKMDENSLLYKEVVNLISSEFLEVDTDVERPLALTSEKIHIKNVGLVSISSMGSGFQHLLHIICECVVGGADIILLDEPELGLHFNKYTALIDLLIKLAQNGKQIFFTTHSSELGLKFIERIKSTKQEKMAIIHRLYRDPKNLSVRGAVSRKIDENPEDWLIGINRK